MNRKIKFSILLILCVAFTGVMLIFGMNTLKAEATEREITASGTSGNVEWILYDDGELRLEGSHSLGNFPGASYYESVKKITIGKDVASSVYTNFYVANTVGYPNLTSVCLEEGNTSFYVDEYGVLYNFDQTILYLYPATTDIAEYNIPDTVKTIARGAFTGCCNPVRITGCEKLETISQNAFYCAEGLRSITLHEGLFSIENYAFFKCKNLEEISIPGSVAVISKYAFKECSSLKTASAGDGLSEIAFEAFMNCSLLETAELPQSLTTIGQSAFEGCTKLSKIEIPENVSKINLSAFENCSSMENVEIPDGLISVPNDAFNGCTSLKSVTIPGSVTHIYGSAFKLCDSLENVYYKGTIRDWCKISFGNYTANPISQNANLIIDGKIVTDVVVPDGITKIHSNVFSGYEKLLSISLPDSVTEIGSQAFSDCTNLKEIVIPDSVVSVKEKAFYNCKNLSKALLSNSMTEIENQTFNGCTELKEIVIPDSVTAIRDRAFYNCAKLSEFSVSENLVFIGSFAFENTGYYKDYANWDNGFLYLENHLLDVDDKNVAAECVLYSKTKLIASQAFYGCKAIKTVTIPDNTEYINSEAFRGCSNLTSVRLPENLKKIEHSTFYICSSLTNITIPVGASEIGNYAFASCGSLSEIEIPSSVQSIGYSAFGNCSNLKTIILNEGLLKIDRDVFNSATSLTDISLPHSLESLSFRAFTNSAVENIYYNGTKAEWKRLANGATFNDATVHYTLRSDDESVMIHHTDNNFDWEAGNVHLVVENLGNASSSYEQNGFYNRLMVDPIQVLDIKLVDGDGNDIQPLSDEKITVKIKASEEFMNLMKSGLSAVSEYDIAAKNIDFSDDCFIFENNGEIISVPADESFLKKFKIIHWYSDAVEPTDHESFTHDELSVKNGYIVLETNHFSEYAVCTELVELELGEIELVNGKSTSVSVTVSDSTEVTYTSSDESVVTVDENGLITAVGPGTATITVTINGTNISDTCEVTVPARDYTIKWIVDDVETEQTVTEQTVITQPEDPEKEGYTFVGWTPSVPDAMPAQNLEFTAVWQVNQYTITFDTAGGSAISPITLDYGSAVTAPESPVLDGYVFKGWTPEIPDTMPAYDMTLTAVYEKVFVSEINIISLPNKTQYTYRIDSLDLSDIAIQIVYSDGSKKVITDTNAIKAYGFSADSTGTKTVTVEYGGCTAKFDVTVSYAWWQWIIRILLLGFLWY